MSFHICHCSGGHCFKPMLLYVAQVQQIACNICMTFFADCMLIAHRKSGILDARGPLHNVLDALLTTKEGISVVNFKIHHDAESGVRGTSQFGHFRLCHNLLFVPGRSLLAKCYIHLCAGCTHLLPARGTSDSTSLLQAVKASTAERVSTREDHGKPARLSIAISADAASCHGLEKFTRG